MSVMGHGCYGYEHNGLETISVVEILIFTYKSKIGIFDRGATW